MKKTKKLGKYFTKGLQAGVLATALVTGMTGCPTPSSSNGGYEIDDNHGNNNNEQGNEWQQPAFYIDEELGGQVFVDPNQQWGNKNIFTVTGYYEDSYKNAQQFMTTKVDELKKAIVGQTSISLYQEIDEALKKMNQGDNIRNNVIGNYTALATVFADINNNRSNFANDSKKYSDYKCSYYKLAHHAYNQALHSKHAEDKTRFFQR